jgi:hypothetical protein
MNLLSSEEIVRARSSLFAFTMLLSQRADRSNQIANKRTKKQHILGWDMLEQRDLQEWVILESMAEPLDFLLRKGNTDERHTDERHTDERHTDEMHTDERLLRMHFERPSPYLLGQLPRMAHVQIFGAALRPCSRA